MKFDILFTVYKFSFLFFIKKKLLYVLVREVYGEKPL